MAARSSVAFAEPQERVLVIERIFDAPRDLLFKCWTEAEHLARWIGPKGFGSNILAWDLRQGGKYRIHKCGPDGQEHWQQGVFCEIVPARADRPHVLLDGRRRQADPPRDLADRDLCGCGRQDPADAASGCLRVGRRVR
jgi:hypothetical protein